MKLTGNSLNFDEMFKLLRHDNKILIEIGANNGSTSLEFLRRMYNNDRLFCIEPDPRCIIKHQYWVKDSRSQLSNMAIHNENKNILFHLCTSVNPNPIFSSYGQWDCASSIKKPKETLKSNPWLRYEEDVVVKGVTLDSFCQENNIDFIDFIWCDVEGHYGEVVAGGINMLKKTKYFYTEYSEEESYEGEIMYEGLVNMMKSINHEVLHKFENDILFVNREINV